MRIKTKNLTTSGLADTGLLFVVGLFFLTIAFATVYVSYFGLAPLPKPNAPEGVSAAASLSLPKPAPAISSEPAIVNDKNKEFLDSLPRIPVKEIFIGSYGTVDKGILDELRDEVENTYGVKTTLLNPSAAIPKVEPFYDKDHNRYNSDVLLKSVEQLSNMYGQATRFLYVVDINMSSFSDEKSPQAEWLRAEKGQNAAIISLYAFHVGGRDALLDRAKKTAIRALGITVGFGFSPSAGNVSCLMSPALTLAALDAKGNALCDPEAETVGRIFQK